MEAKHTRGPVVDQFGDLVTVPGALLYGGQNHQFRAAAFELVLRGHMFRHHILRGLTLSMSWKREKGRWKRELLAASGCKFGVGVGVGGWRLEVELERRATGREAGRAHRTGRV